MLRRLQDIVEYALFLMLALLVGTLSLSGATAVGRALGSAVFTFTPVRKKVTMSNLRSAFPEKDESELRRIAHRAYRSYGTSIAIMLWCGRQSEERLRASVAYRSREVYDAAVRKGKGVIVLSAHFGNWELLPPTLDLTFGYPMLAIVQRQRNGYIDRRIDALRSRFGTTTVTMGGSVREVLGALRRGDSILILGDQSGPKESEFVPFFGRLAATHRGAAAFSLRTGAPIIMVILVRRDDATTEAMIEEIDQTGIDGTGDQAIAELTRRHTATLEKYVRLHPDQWLWMHKRWKHAPPSGGNPVQEEGAGIS